MTAHWTRRPVRSIVVENLQVLAGLALVGLTVVRNDIEAWLTGQPLNLSATTVLAAIASVGCVVSMIGNVIGWSRFGYRVDDTGLHVKTGVLSTTISSYAPGRIHGIEIDEPVVQRLAGLVTLRVEVSGGADSSAEIAYLPRAEAERVQAHLRTLRAPAPAPPGAPEHADEPVHPNAEDADVHASGSVRAHESMDEVLALGPDRARQYVLRSPGLWLMACAAVALVGLGVTIWVKEGITSALSTLLIGFGAAVATLRGGAHRWQEVASWRVEANPEELRISRGRLNRSHSVVRTDRVSALVLRQGPVRRRHGWWEVSVAVSALASSSSETSRTVCAVATDTEVAALVERLMPHLPEPTTAEIVSVLSRSTPPDHWVRCHRFARWWSPLGWRFHGVCLHPEHLLVRGGRWRRELQVMTRRTIQTTATLAGPFARHAGTATLEISMAPGPTSSTTVPHLSVRDAEKLFEQAIVSQPPRARPA